MKELSKEQREILEEMLRRKEQDPFEGLFDKQLAFIGDKSRKKTAFCSRRAGKTWSMVRYMVKVCLDKPNALVAYITKTRGWAKKLVWVPMKKMSEAKGWGIQFNNQDLVATFPNGSEICLAGADNREEPEKLRGFAYDLVILDEAGSFDPVIMAYILEEVLPAALMDYKGILCVVGTPDESCCGFFHSITTRPELNFSVHRWTIQDNPMFPRWVHKDEKTGKFVPDDDWKQQAKELVEEERIEHNWEHDDPKYLRELWGIWARSDDNFLYSLDIGRDRIDTWDLSSNAVCRYVLGVDLGWRDKTAFVCIAYNPVEQVVYQVELDEQSGLTVPNIGEKIEYFIEKYGLECVVIDAAGAGKILQETFAEEFQLRYGILVKAAEKNKKQVFIKLANSGFKEHKNKILDAKLFDQLKPLQWDERRLREKEGQQCDLADAWLYAWREAFHWLKEAPRGPVVEVNSPEWHQAEEAKRVAEDVQQFEKEEEYWY